MTLRFEIGATVILMGEDLQFTGADGDARVKVLIQAEALRLLAKAVKPLSQQEKFKVYDRNRAYLQMMQATAVRLYEKTPAKVIKIRPLDL